MREREGEWQRERERAREGEGEGEGVGEKCPGCQFTSQVPLTLFTARLIQGQELLINLILQVIVLVYSNCHTLCCVSGN